MGRGWAGWQLAAVSGFCIQVRGRDRRAVHGWAVCPVPQDAWESWRMGIRLAHCWASRGSLHGVLSVRPGTGAAFPESHDSIHAGPAVSVAAARPLTLSHLLALTGLQASSEYNLPQGSHLDTVRRSPQVCYPPHSQAAQPLGGPGRVSGFCGHLFLLCWAPGSGEEWSRQTTCLPPLENINCMGWGP